jgi:phospholipase/carboxylesterase
MTAKPGELDEAIAGLVTPLLAAMDVLAQAGRMMHPPRVSEIATSVGPYRQPVADGLRSFKAASWPDHMTPLREPCIAAAEAILEGYDGLAAAHDPMSAYAALRFNTLAQEALYPVAPLLSPVSRFFLPQERRQDEELLARLTAADATRDSVGVIHAANERDQRGGFSLYVPEYYEAAREWPLVVALHGGSGHGRDFLWTWLKAARAAGVLILSATSRGRTWSLMGPDIDSTNLHEMIEWVAAQYRIDRSRMLLTGMSDGGTFAMLSGVMHALPATHLAPIAASFHPALLEHAPEGRLEGLPVYLTHGALDWMFPVQMARDARDALVAAGARLEYREIADLSHTYPREENSRILDWLRH